MFRTKKILAVAAICVASGLGVAACGSSKPSATQATQRHQETSIDSQLQALEKAEPIPTLHDSADRKVQAYFYTAEADPNKIWYLATLSYTGSVEATYTIRGPVEPAGDEVTNPDQINCHYSNDNYDCEVIPLAEPNGIYEHNNNDHIAILTSGAMLRFEGNYQVSDQPFNIHTPVSLTVNASAPVSNTDLSKTTGGVLPPKG